MPNAAIKCPQCSSERLYKDGLRYLTNGETVQRLLCRKCGYRFSQTNRNHSNKFQHVQKVYTPILNSPKTLTINRQGSNEATSRAPIAKKAVQTLVEVDPQKEHPAREGTVTSQAVNKNSATLELIFNYAWQAKKQGMSESTIKQRVYRFKQLANKGADLMNPESVSTVLAKSSWTQANKRTLIIAYKSFCKTFNLSWRPPKTRVERKIPFIPTEEQINQLIAGCGKKTATFLQVLKETGARTAEAAKLKWMDIDENSHTIRINNPVKGSLARIVKVSPQTIAMINALPKTSDYIFNPNQDTIRKNFCRQRTQIAQRLQNQKLKLIHLHTFRHWKATMEYHRTKNIKWVQQLLGHKKLENTDLYTQLINFESDEWHVATARNLEEEKKLIETGFEFVRYSEKDEVAIYRKRK